MEFTEFGGISLCLWWVMKATPTAAVEGLLRLPPLHVIETEAQTGCNQQWKLKSTNFGQKNFKTWSLNPS
jgi:hypothetical protein